MILRLAQLFCFLAVVIYSTDSILTFNMHNAYLMNYSIEYALTARKVMLWLFGITMLMEYTIWSLSSEQKFRKLFFMILLCTHPLMISMILQAMMPWYWRTYIHLGITAEMLVFAIIIELVSGRRFWNRWDDLIIVVFLVGTHELYNKAKAKILRA